MLTSLLTERLYYTGIKLFISLPSTIKSLYDDVKVFEQHLKIMRVYSKVSRLAAWNENCKWYSSLPPCAVVSVFCESV
jgi:hypothetical protein